MSRMHVVRYDSVGSTSDEAIRLFTEAAVELPVAVIAGEQPHGRGRTLQGQHRAAHWDSPKGNLHISMLWGTPGWDLAPLLAVDLLRSVVAAEVLRGVSIKWPNDILVGGEKIAGILVETGHVPQRGEYICVGIGWNVKVAPSQADYPTCSLYDIRDDSTASLESLADSVMDIFAERFFKPPCSWQVPERSYCCPMITVIPEQKRYAEWIKMGKKGEWVGDLWHGDGGRQSVVYSSAQQSPVPLLWYRYRQARKASQDPFDLIPLWIAEIGNSHVRVVKVEMCAQEPPSPGSQRCSRWWTFVDQRIWSHQQLFPQGRHVLGPGARMLRAWLWTDDGQNEDQEQPPPWLEAAQNTAPPYFIVSTHRGMEEGVKALVDAMDHVSWTHYPVPKKLSRLSLSHRYPLDEIGRDRLYFLEAVIGHPTMRQPRDLCPTWTMAVSFGSAVTVDFVSADGVFMEGYILPSAFLAVRALNEWIDGIQHTHVKKKKPSFAAAEEGGGVQLRGHSTQKAVEDGTYAEKIGAIAYLFRHVVMNLEPKQSSAFAGSVFVAGGKIYVDALQQALAHEWRVLRAEKGGENAWGKKEGGNIARRGVGEKEDVEIVQDVDLLDGFMPSIFAARGDVDMRPVLS